MKKKYTLGFILSLLFINNVIAQNYYYYQGQKQNLVLDKSGLDIYVNNNYTIGNASNNLKSFSLVAISNNEKTHLLNSMVLQQIFNISQKLTN